MMSDGSATLDDGLYALVLHLHPQCNRDLLEGITRERIPVNGLVLLERLRGGQRRPTIKQAAALVGMDGRTGGASRLVEKLVNEDLVRCEPHEDDYRSKRVAITDRGEEVISRLHAARREQIGAFVEQLDDQEREQLQSALKRLLRRDAIAAMRRLPSA